jgi:hypothetical protein
MAAARISPYPVPSFNQWRYNYPMRAPAHNQWKGVFYESGTTKHMQRQTLLREKRRMQTAENTFRAEREAVIKAHPDVLKQALAASSATAAAAAATTTVTCHGSSAPGAGAPLRHDERARPDGTLGAADG